jgi:hypothetical protein
MKWDEVAAMIIEMGVGIFVLVFLCWVIAAL